MAPLWPLYVYFFAAVGVVAAILVVSHYLGERHSEPATGEPYESGILPTGSARLRLSVAFYQVAVLFVIFDLEAVFLVTWAVAARELGWRGYGEITTFSGVLLVALFYLWRAGALDWGTSSRRRPPSRRAELAA